MILYAVRRDKKLKWLIFCIDFIIPYSHPKDYALKFSNPGHIDGTAYNYTLPMVIFASCGVVAMLLGIWLKAEDRRKHYGLELPNIKK